YDRRFEEVRRVVAVTKADIVPEIAEEQAAVLAAHVDAPVRVVSAQDGTGLDALKRELFALVRDEQAKAASQEEVEIVVRPEPQERFRVEREGEGRFRVEGRRPVTFVEMMDVDDEAARFEIYRRLERWG